MLMEGIIQWACKYFHIASVQLPRASFASLSALHSKEMIPSTIYSMEVYFLRKGLRDTGVCLSL